MILGRDQEILGRLHFAGNQLNFSVHVAAVTDIKSLHLDELRGIAEPSYRADQIAHWLYQKRVNSFAEMTDLPQALRTKLADDFSFNNIDTLRVLGSKDTTQKFLFRLSDGNLIESVLIPASPALYGSPSDRRTICISTQVGCAYGCKFCASGLDGWKRNLRADEIVNQIMMVEEASGERIDNIVFMGMGEPLANYDNLMRAIQIINAPWGIGIGARHITISTSGLVPQIRQLAEQPLQIRLAVSLHGASDDVRSRIMPINRKYNLNALLDACRYFTSRKKQRITFEFILIAQVNDSDEQARQLAKHARALEAKVNLIPYNKVEGLDWTQPSSDRQKKFLAVLRAADVRATLRREKGDDIAAACGQLRLQTQRSMAAPALESSG
jgi:23S rRNA (adenine2503-C2)-methyltransferase